MIKTVISAVMAVALTACGGGGGLNIDSTGTSTVETSVNTVSIAAALTNSSLQLVGQYKNEVASSSIFNSTVADLNGDGLDDIVVSSWARNSDTTATRSGFTHIRLFIQQPNGELKDLTSNLVRDSTIWGSQRSIVMDFDNDGKLDIALMGFQDGASAVPAPSVIFWNNGNEFARQDLPEPVSAHAACAGDLTGDGLPEIVVGGTNAHPNTIYQNQGQRILRFEKTFTTKSISAGGACAVLKDHTNGNVAVVSTNMMWNLGHSAVAHVWDRNFNFLRSVPLPGSEEPTYNVNLVNDIVNVIPIDVNGDGLVDLILTNNGNWQVKQYNGSITVLINQGNFVFTNETARYLPVQNKNTFFNYYYNLLTVDGSPAFFVDNGLDGVSIWQLKNGVFSKYKEQMLNNLSRGHRANVYRTAQGLSLFLINEDDFPYATFYTKAIPND